MNKKYEPLGVELRALIGLLVFGVQIVLAIRAEVHFFDLLILDLTLAPLMFLRRKRCCQGGKLEDQGGAV